MNAVRDRGSPCLKERPSNLLVICPPKFCRKAEFIASPAPGSSISGIIPHKPWRLCKCSQMVMNSYFWPSAQGKTPVLKHLNADSPKTIAGGEEIRRMHTHTHTQEIKNGIV